jgi:DNA polymerase-3 subunit beta
MNVTITRKDLLRLVARAAPVADRRGTMPVLGCVLLRYQGGYLTVAATDLYLSMVGRCEADGTEPGAIALPARDLLDRVKAMSDGPINITADDKTTTIKGSGARRYKMSHLPGVEFPELPHVFADDAYRIPCVDVATVLARASYAVSPDETRPNLNSLEMTFSDGHIGATGTDGHRLAHHNVKCDGVTNGLTVLLPLKGAKELAKLVADGGTVSLATTDRWLFASIDECTLSCKLAEAVFPSWKNVIPRGACETVDVPRRALLDCVRAVSVASPASTNGVRLTFKKGVLGIASDSPEKGDAVDEVAIDFAGKPVTIGFAARYLTEALECLESDPVTVEVRGELDPIVIRDGAYAAVVMPMRIQ